MPVEDFERRWTERAGDSPFTTFGDSAPATRAELQRRLESGRFTVVLAVDGINADLQRMVEYLNAVTVPEVQVLAFEVARVADQDVEILLPRVFGAELAQAKSSSGGSQPSWSEAAYLAWMQDNEPTLLDIACGILDDAREVGFVVDNGTATSPSLILGVRREAGNVWPISIYTTPRCYLQVRVYQVRDAAGDAAALTRTLAEIPGSNVDVGAYLAADYRRRTDLELRLLADSRTRQQLLAALWDSLR